MPQRHHVTKVHKGLNFSNISFVISLRLGVFVAEKGISKWAQLVKK